MGAWGHNTFEDDMACDWIGELCDSSDPVNFMKQTLTISESDEYLDSDVGVPILAASETVYTLLHGIRGDPPDDFKEWIAKNASLDVSTMTAMTIAALHRILAPDSEIQELWKENEELFPKWRANVQELIDVLST